MNESLSQMPDMSAPLRVVMEHRTGRLAGLSQIVGMTDGPLAKLPTMVEGRTEEDTRMFCLVRVRRGAVYYKQLMAPEGLGTFDRSQR